MLLHHNETVIANLESCKPNQKQKQKTLEILKFSFFHIYIINIIIMSCR